MRTCKYLLPLLFVVLMAGNALADDWSGVLGEKPADAKEGVVAVLKVKAGDKETTVNLWAEGDTGKKLAELASKKAEVTVSGDKVDDSNVKVTKVEKKE